MTDTDAHRVGTLDIPGHDLLSVSSDQPGATVNTAVVSADRTANGDTHTEVTADLATTEKPLGSAYAIVATDQLAAAIETNSVYDQSSGDATRERGRIWRSVSATETITADVTGADYVDLVAGDAGDGNGNDHADWADATFHCGSRGAGPA